MPRKRPPRAWLTIGSSAENPPPGQPSHRENYLFLGRASADRRESVQNGELVEGDFVGRLVECVVDDPGRDYVNHGLRGVGGDRDDLLHEVQVKRRPTPRLAQATLHALMDARIEARDVAH